MRVAPALAALLVLSACAHRHTAATSSISLDKLLAFSDPSRCLPSQAHQQLLAQMVAGNANDGFQIGRIAVPPAHSRAFGKIFLRRYEHYTVIGVPLNGKLFGLPILSVEQALPEGGDPGDVTYRYQADVETVERELRTRGFPAEAGRAVSLGTPEAYDHIMELIADPERSDQTLLSCGYQ